MVYRSTNRNITPESSACSLSFFSLMWCKPLSVSSIITIIDIVNIRPSRTLFFLLQYCDGSIPYMAIVPRCIYDNWILDNCLRKLNCWVIYARPLNPVVWHGTVVNCCSKYSTCMAQGMLLVSLLNFLQFLLVCVLVKKSTIGLGNISWNASRKGDTRTFCTQQRGRIRGV